MADTIQVKFKVMKDGSLKAVGKDADRAAAGLDKASNASANYNRKQKGVAGATSNSTKAFSKMSGGITGGLVPAYATLAANVFALSAAFGLLSRNDAIGKLNEGLIFTGNAAGKNLTMVADKLKDITDNAISAEAAMRATAVGVSAGFSEGQLESLTKVAKGASLALGRDMGDAMDRLIRGAAKLEPEILDELGIMVRLDDATKKYADSVNKNVKELTQFERRMAFTNAVIADGTSKFQDIAREIEASPYSQLSAAFSDLTKTGVQFLNKFLTPLISFLANNSTALATVILALGASISSTLLSSLGEMAAGSAAAAKQTANLAKVSLNTLKPMDHMAKGFNNLAGKVDLTDKELKKMANSAKLTVNMMNKGNPKLAQAVATRGQLTRAIHLNTMALNKEAAATAFSMIETHGLSAAFTAHSAVLAQNRLSTAAATVGQNGYTSAIIRTRGALFALATTAKFAGAALLTAMPYLMAFMVVASLIGPLIVGLFSETEDKLSKQLEDNTERLDKFNDVVAQYGRSINKANNASDAWYRTLKPLAGLFGQIKSLIGDTALAAETDRIIANAKARERLIAANKALSKSQTTNTVSQFQGVTPIVERSQAAKQVAATESLSDEDINKINEAAIAGLAKLIASTDQMIAQAGKSEAGATVVAEATALMTGQRILAQKVLDDLIATEVKSAKSAKIAEDSIGRISTALENGLKSYENFNEIVAKAAVLGNVSTFGEFADEIDNVAESVNSLDAILKDGKGDTAAEERAKQIVDAYGLIPKAIASVATAYSTETGKEVPMFETSLQTVKNFKEALVAYNKDMKALAVEREQFSIIQDIVGSDSIRLGKMALEISGKAHELGKKRLSLTKKRGEDEYAAKLALIQLEKDHLALIKERFDALSSDAKDSGMGKAASAAIAGQGVRLAAEAGTVGESGTYATDEDKSAAIAEAAANQARGTLKGVAEDMKALGPEGGLMSSVIEGALNMETAFATAFAAMGADGASTADKIQAGLGLASAAISALANMSAASSAAKIKGIDQEISAEKARDGTSAASVAKLAALEKKKESAKRKAFEIDKKMKMAQTVIGTAQAVTSMLGSAPFPFNIALAGLVAAMGAQQLSMISSTSFQGGGGGAASVSGATSISAGQRGSSVDMAKSQSAGGELSYLRGDSGMGGPENFRPTPAFSGYKNRAAGGFVVGEQGPEVFMPEVAGDIIPAGQSMGSNTNVNFSINAVDADGVEDLLVRQRGNIIGMMREAANSYGQDFMEGIDTSVYTPSSAGARRY